MKKIVLGLGTLVLSLGMLVTPATAKGHSSHRVNLSKGCDGVFDASAGVQKKVTVKRGQSCTLEEGLVVRGGVHAKKGAKNLYVHTTVGRNIQANGVTGTVHIGPKSCKYDPPVGNNVKVRKSHNVLICWVTAKNNIEVTDSDGRITVRDSVAGNSIKVNRNRAYSADGPVRHNRAGAIRILRNEYGNHLQTKHNNRQVIARDNHKL